MKKLNLVVSAVDDDIELVFVCLGPLSVGIRLDRLPAWLVTMLRPKVN